MTEAQAQPDGAATAETTEADFLDPGARIAAAVAGHEAAEEQEQGGSEPENPAEPVKEPEKPPEVKPEPAKDPQPDEKPKEPEEEPDKRPEEDELPEKTHAAAVKAFREAREARAALRAAEKKATELEAQIKDVGDLKATRDWIASFKANPYAHMESLGLSLDGWTEYSSNGGKAGPIGRIQQLEAEIEQLKASKSEPAKPENQPTQAEIDEAMSNYRNDIRAQMAKPENQHVAKLGTIADVLEYATVHLAETKQVLTPEMAVRAYNEYLKAEHPDLLTEEPAKKDPEPAPEPEKKPEPKKPEEAQVRALDGQTGSIAPLSEEDMLDPQARIAVAISAHRAREGA